MKPTVYVESSVVSYLTTLPSRDLVRAAHQRLTRNCTHIANATMRGTIEVICRSAGVEPPVICTPEELAKEA